jgi:hemerythrin
MKMFTWDQKYSVEIVSIDNEHQVLFDLINKLYEAMSQGKARDVMSGIVEELYEYTKTHFRREEFYFKSISYPESDEHKAQHDAFVQKINHYKQLIKEGDTSFSVEVLTFLRDWLIKHIQGTDKKYVPYFKKYGIR